METIFLHNIHTHKGDIVQWVVVKLIPLKTPVVSLFCLYPPPYHVPLPFSPTKFPYHFPYHVPLSCPPPCSPTMPPTMSPTVLPYHAPYHVPYHVPLPCPLPCPLPWPLYNAHLQWPLYNAHLQWPLQSSLSKHTIMLTTGLSSTNYGNNSSTRNGLSY